MEAAEKQLGPNLATNALNAERQDTGPTNAENKDAAEAGEEVDQEIAGADHRKYL